MADIDKMSPAIVKPVDRATAYAEKVAAGDFVACKPHRQACERHLRDLSRQGSSDFPYTWRPEKSERIIDFANTLTLINGKRPTQITLYGCQEFDLGVPMGWYNAHGNRRFRRKYKSVARQNGKTLENGITAAYLSGFSDYRYEKIFTVATSVKQARLAWEKARNFIIADPDLRDRFDIKDYKSYIESVRTGCTIEALSKQAGLEDGFSSIFASVDEVHQHRDNSIYKAMYDGQRSQPEALLSMITTRGFNQSNFCWEIDGLCCSILAGGVTMEDFFADIYTLDEGDDLYDPALFLKSNPMLCQTEHGIEVQLSDAATAKAMGGQELVNYMVKCQNMWSIGGEDMFTDAPTLKKCRSDLTIADFRGCACFGGIDLSSGGDLTTLALEFERDGWFFSWSISFMPRGRQKEHMLTDVAPYDQWERDGLIIVTGGKSDYKNDYGFIVSTLRQMIEFFDLKLLGIGYDPHNADGFLSQLEDFGVPLLEIRQSARFLNDGTEDVQLLMKSGKYLIDEKNELQDWSFRNARIVKNSFGEKKVDKDPKAKNRRIDPVDAAIDAHIARMKLTEAEIDYDGIMARYLAGMGMDGKADK